MNEKKDIRDAYDMKLLDQILRVGCDIIYCLGWNYILGGKFISKCQDNRIKIINLHPSLPNDNALIGLNSIKRAYEQYKEGTRTETGIMVHYVIEAVDKGAPIVSNKLTISECESEDDYYHKMDIIEKKTVIDALDIMIENTFYEKFN